MRLDSVVRMIGITISPQSYGNFEADSVALAGAKGMWCNGEIIMFQDVTPLYGEKVIVRVKQDFISAYERMVSKGNLTDMKSFIILNETGV